MHTVLGYSARGKLLSEVAVLSDARLAAGGRDLDDKGRLGPSHPKGSSMASTKISMPR